MIQNKLSQNGYNNCIKIYNKTTIVIIEPDCGGRILTYSYKGGDVIYKNWQEDGYLLESGQPPMSGLSPCAGRCDIGPEMTTPKHDELWLGRWEVGKTEDLSVELISQEDKNTGVQLRRVFKLDANSSKLSFT
ncbi:MAG: hypothetical protein MI922_15515 [Bacteroidales bacterium]|nr:hypothetical protein [Bacteroidales bacterium]